MVEASQPVRERGPSSGDQAGLVCKDLRVCRSSGQQVWGLPAIAGALLCYYHTLLGPHYKERAGELECKWKWFSFFPLIDGNSTHTFIIIFCSDGKLFMADGLFSPCRPMRGIIPSANGCLGSVSKWPHTWLSNFLAVARPRAGATQQMPWLMWDNTLIAPPWDITSEMAPCNIIP